MLSRQTMLKWCTQQTITIPHWLKYVRIRSYSGLYFLTFGRNTRNADQNNSKYEHFLRSACFFFAVDIGWKDTLLGKTHKKTCLQLWNFLTENMIGVTLLVTFSMSSDVFRRERSICETMMEHLWWNFFTKIPTG